ncbi:MAG: efflux RND transporter periplasmic adaptor subunit [Candidatus Rokubacteria bacterium]|nr:efflux RND transporter periplasmic adaptor subunit [Candidatus Rokubacteria bacterium]
MRVDELEVGMVPGGDTVRTNHRMAWLARAARVSSLLTVLALVAVVGAGVWAWRANASGKPAMDMNMRISAGAAAFPVTLAPVERGPVSGSVTYTGTVVPYVEEDVFPRVMGRIVAMPVYPGDAVKPGQIVARLDDVELGSRVQEAAAGSAAATANVAQMETDVVAARHGVAQMEREIAMAEAEVAAARDGITQMERELQMTEADAGYQEQVSARDERLFETGAVARQDVESARAMVTAARAKVAAARAKVSQMRAMATAAEAKLSAARARLERERAMEAGAGRKRDAMAAMATQSRAMQRTAEVVRDYVNIRASSGGYVVKRLVSPGVLVDPRMPILKIAQIDRVRLQANVGERDVASIKVGSSVRVTTTAREDSQLVAKVTSVFPFVDAGSRTAIVEAVVENSARRFLPGQYVTMDFVTGEQADVLTVPRSGVARMGGAARVWVVTDGRAEPRDVTTGLESADRVEIRAGLTGGERIVARGHEGLYARARVAEVKSTTPPSSAARPKEGGHAGH